VSSKITTFLAQFRSIGQRGAAGKRGLRGSKVSN
jgi:hypothetical protein